MKLIAQADSFIILIQVLLIQIEMEGNLNKVALSMEEECP